MKLAVVMDPIESINTKKDSSFAMMLEIQRRGWDLFYMQQSDLFLLDGESWANMKKIEVQDNTTAWFNVVESVVAPVRHLDAVLMRKDPPFDME